MVDETLKRIAAEAGFDLMRSEPLHGGMIGEVHKVTLSDGTPAVAKLDRSGKSNLEREGYMLSYLEVQSGLPVPEVLHSSDECLLMEFVDGRSVFSAKAERDAAELLVGLHSVTSECYGLERDTLIGSLSQPNPPTESWIEFFREHRLSYMSDVAHEAGRLPLDVRRRIEGFASRVDEFIGEPERPALIHGDVWSQNVLAKGDRITAFIDPAIYYADPEMELAYISMFDSFGEEFFRRYDELQPIPSEFFEIRRHVYALYPLLCHVYFFGGGYVGMVERTLSRFGL